MPREFGLSPRGDEANALLDQPDFFGDSVKAPTDLTWKEDDQFTFTSPVKSPYPNNDVVPGKLYKAAEDWRKCPTVVMVHSYNIDFAYHGIMQHWIAQLPPLGVNVVLWQLPYHLERLPGKDAPVKNYFCGDLHNVALAVHQSLADLRCILRWLEAEGVPRIGLWGNSLGGWLSGLTLSHDPAVKFAAFLAPAARMDLALETLSFAHTMREAMAQQPLAVDRLNLINFQPLCGGDNLFIAAGRYDQFIPLSTLDSLRKAWSIDNFMLTHHGHISIMVSEAVLDRTALWLRDKAFTED